MNEEQKAAAIEQMKRDKERAPRIEDIAKMYLDLGADPKYVAHRTGFPLERCLKYLEAISAQKAKKAERIRGASGGGDV